MGQRPRVFVRRGNDVRTPSRCRPSLQAKFQRRVELPKIQMRLVEPPRTIGVKHVVPASPRGKSSLDIARMCTICDNYVLIVGTSNGHRGASTHLGNISRKSTQELHSQNFCSYMAHEVLGCEGEHQAPIPLPSPMLTGYTHTVHRLSLCPRIKRRSTTYGSLPRVLFHSCLAFHPFPTCD